MSKLLALADDCEIGPGNFNLECRIAEAIGYGGMPPPNYTVSRDTAASLLPDGWFVAMIHYVPIDELWHVEVRSPGRGANAKAKTEALARCAAALRAREVA